MNIKTSPQQQFLLYIHKINEDSPQAILPSLAQLSSILINQNLTSQSLALLKQWVSTLQDLCEHLSEVDKLHLLSDYFFNELSFNLNTTKENSPQEKDLLLSSMILQRSASFLPLAFLYHYLAQQINLPLFFIASPKLNLLKYYGRTSCLFVDFKKLGKLTAIDDNTNIKTLQTYDLEVCSFKSTYVCYLQTLLQYYAQELTNKNTKEIKLALEILEKQEKPLADYAIDHLNGNPPPLEGHSSAIYTLH
ncbi:MAG: hypothetical protein HAW63_03200 [Bdellovibrionaceae bacterium]|nr:hypothetical protein [Pseudobdellovibrionaceae bacterium]